MTPFTFDDAVKPFAISLHTFLRQNPEYTHVATGAFVFHDNRLLIVKRAASETFLPNLWETPGGGVDAEDETILHGLVRELQEEAGLVATRVVCTVGNKDILQSGDENWIKLSFIVEVDNLTMDKGMPPIVILNPEEHSAFYWISEAELSSGKATDGSITFEMTTSAQYEAKKIAFILHAQHMQEAAGENRQQNHLKIAPS